MIAFTINHGKYDDESHQIGVGLNRGSGPEGSTIQNTQDRNLPLIVYWSSRSAIKHPSTRCPSRRIIHHMVYVAIVKC